MLIVILCRSMNGILEMNGFQHIFHRVYQSDSKFDSELMSQSGSKNMSCHSENHTDTNHSYCSSGNGLGSDTLIVRKYRIHNKFNSRP